MTLYHGSMSIVQRPDVSFGRDKLDFGKGFYTTKLQQQAEHWVQRFLRLKKRAYVNSYEFNDANLSSAYRYKVFPAYDEEWLDYIIACRSGSEIFRQYDVVEGGVANDRIFNTIELYLEGLIDKQAALAKLKYEKPNNQICFISQELVDRRLPFIDYYEVKL